MLSRAAPWSPSRSRPPGRAVRRLSDGDTAALAELVGADPVANVFVAAHLAAHGTAAGASSGAEIVGMFDGDGRLMSACWLGANVVPVEVPADHAQAYADVIRHSRRRFASIFGPAEATLAIFAELSGPAARDVRRAQPLLAMEGSPAVAPDPLVRVTTADDFDTLAPACVSMFEEEVGYSPVAGGSENYYRRVRQLIDLGHSFARFGEDGEVVFKAELGSVSPAASQVQGVWVEPSHRGEGLSHGGMAAVVEHARRLAPVVSLYVNDYNYKARASYRRVGFEQVGTFATVLF
ncbi:GNAT family N-acetyltransferase [Sinomonas sp. JC656]|uniref:GNAT family N-acetyltransferase n=1 Tax=Sinomonas cellulolyticus TaxID=2801916 RepID=A0ABS1K5E6_9MICC|nr:GNAT family N-acetyltransferase [Sinomonas cellulolyticus]